MLSNTKKLKISVIIATFNRGNIIAECLTSLKKQTIGNEYFNIIVVDNNSTDNTQEILAPFLSDWPQLKIIEEYKQGAGHARNAALDIVTTEWVACLDSDGKAHPNWIATILDTIREDKFDAFGGPYYAWHFFGPPPRWFPPDFGVYEAQQNYGPLQGDSYIPGGNCAFRLAAAKAVNGFPTDIGGMAGGKCLYGEETMMFNRMKATGFRLGYVPTMKIDHCVLPYKYSFSWQTRSFLARGESNYQITYFGTPPIKGFFSIGAKLAIACCKLLFILGHNIFCGCQPERQQETVRRITRVVFHAGQLKAVFLQILPSLSHER